MVGLAGIFKVVGIDVGVVALIGRCARVGRLLVHEVILDEIHGVAQHHIFTAKQDGILRQLSQVGQVGILLVAQREVQQQSQRATRYQQGEQQGPKIIFAAIFFHRGDTL